MGAVTIDTIIKIGTRVESRGMYGYITGALVGEPTLYTITFDDGYINNYYRYEFNVVEG